MSDVAARALAALQDMRAKLAAAEQEKHEPIAIVGMGCRFPGGATDPEAFWRLMRDGVDAIGEVPSDRWDKDAYYDPTPETPGKTYTKLGGFLDRIDLFDAGFFGISAREAALMDPQQRLLLEVAWEALEDAGQATDRLAGSQTGVFIGIGSQDYGRLTLQDPERLDVYSGTGVSNNVAAGRLSYLFDFQGPCVSVDTACSSSLVVVHLAVQSLRQRECRLALAGGVNVMITPDATLVTSLLRMLAPDGRCKTFDSRADGYVRGEGCGLIVLKRLSDALADGDRILALIKGSAINQDGRSAGMTAPNILAQQAVIRQALANARLEPSDISYVEAHGTGTPLGDPIEVEALTAVLGGPRAGGRPCALGSVKTNVGHLEGAAGIAGLMKVVLALRHETIPPHLHLLALNPNIVLEGTPFVVPTEPLAWSSSAGRRCAGVSSFGWSGTNAHLILEEAPAPSLLPDSHEEGPKLIPLSARSPEALMALVRAVKERLPAEAALSDLAPMAALRRSHLEHRIAVVASDRMAFGDTLDAYLNGETRLGLSHGIRSPGRRVRPVFVFSGQGPQWWAMGRELYAHEPTYRATIDELDGWLRAHATWSLKEELLADEARSRLAETAIAQPALFALQLALADLWRSWGVVPAAVVGHSVGEVAAACVAGVLSRPDAFRLIVHRGRLMQQATGLGKMAAVEWPLEEARRELARFGERLAIGAINGPCSLTLSGEADAIDELVLDLQARGHFARVMGVNYAFHSAIMAPYSQELTRSLSGLVPMTARIRLVSTLTGTKSDGQDYSPDYWGRQLREPVQFAGAMERLIDEGFDTFVEIGPHPVLAVPLSEILVAKHKQGLTLPSLRRNEPERETMLASLGALYTAGYQVEWAKLYPHPRRYVPLPTYPWQRSRHWVESARGMASSGRAPIPVGTTKHPLLGAFVPSPVHPGTYLWAMELGPDVVPSLSDHRVQGRVVLPATDYVEIALAAATEAFGPGPHGLAEVKIDQALILPEGDPQTLELVITALGPDRATFQFFSRQKATHHSPWRLHAHGTLQLRTAGSAPDHEGPAAVRARCPARVSGDDHAAAMRARGFDYGPTFRGVQELWRGESEALGKLALTGSARSEAPVYHAHRTLLDAGAQVLQSLLPSDSTYLPVELASLTVYDGATKACWGHARIRSGLGTGRLVGDLLLLDEGGRVLLSAEGLVLRRLEAMLAPDVAPMLYDVAWQPSAASASNAQLSGAWLILADDRGMGDRLVQELTSRGAQCVLVRPNDPADLSSLLSRHLSESPLQGVLHLWGLGGPQEIGSVDDLIRAQHHGVESLLTLVQALARGGHQEPLRLLVVTEGVQPIGDNATPVPTHAPMWGLARAIRHEHAEWSLRCLDLEAGVDPIPTLLAELADDGLEDQVAWRAGRRYAARLVPHEVPPPGRRSWRSEGTVLITGGLGALGLKTAEWLISQGAKNLVLMGRQAPSAQANDAIQALRLSGAAVRIEQADVSDRVGLARVFEALAQTWPPMRGVVHAAGVLDDGVLLQLNADRLQRVLAPKVQGAWNLHELTRQLDLDFFVMYSSAVAVLGGPGQGNYGAANAFLDALAAYRSAQGLPGLSLDWGPWAEVGMAAASADRGDRAASLGILSLPPEQGLEALERLIWTARGQVAVIPIDWGRFAPVASSWPLLSDLVGQLSERHTLVPQGSLRSSVLSKPYPERQRALAGYLKELTARTLGVSQGQLSIDTPLNLLGIDSLKAMELKNRLATDLGLTLPMVQFLEGPSLSQLAHRLVESFTPPEDSWPEVIAQSDEESLAQALAELEGMTDEEALAHLEQE